MSAVTTKCRLYLITPPSLQWREFETRLRDAFSGGDVACIQLRLKNSSDEEILDIAKKMILLCHAYNAAFILNDRPDLAKQCGADGVHLGQEDMKPEAARKILGEEAVIGVSCHASRHLAMVAGEEGADYVAFGAFYPTQSKPKEKIDKWGVPAPKILSWWQEVAELPCVAIGGITPENCTPLVQAGADFIAVLSYIWNYPEGPGAAVAKLQQSMQSSANTNLSS